MNPIIVTFVAPPQSQRDEVFNKVIDFVVRDGRIRAITDPIKTDEKLETFEGYYKACLNYMANDIERRAYGRKNKVNVIFYRISLLDLVGNCMASKIIGPEYKMMLEKTAISHLDLFPINLLFYCEPLKNDINDPDFMAKEQLKLRVDNSILSIIEKMDFERVDLDTIENRAEKIVKIINEKLRNL